MSQSTKHICLSDERGRKSHTTTMLVITFVLLSTWLLRYVVVAHIFGAYDIPFVVPAFDGGTAGAWFAPIAALYGARRYTKDVAATTNSSDEETE